MAGDADVVRCAAPWPGAAAQPLEGIAVLGAGAWTPERICAASVTGMAPGDAVQILSGLSVAGVCVRTTTGEAWRSVLSALELRRLANLLRGAEHYRRLRLDPSRTELVVTMPIMPSYLDAELPNLTGHPGGYTTTSEAFLRVSQTASCRLVVMTPFIDQHGFEWLRRVLATTQSHVEKIIVLRDVDQYAAELAVHHAAWLRALNVSVRDYYLPHSSAEGRVLPVETFHAKIILADERLAYVGSANMLGSGDGTSLEAGVLIDGRAVTQIAGLVGGILRIARRL
jgi:phosphatidylserine/phosphatidylglycerophosphate/cardiolipin synthase-like enzyme